MTDRKAVFGVKYLCTKCMKSKYEWLSRNRFMVMCWDCYLKEKEDLI